MKIEIVKWNSGSHDGSYLRFTPENHVDEIYIEHLACEFREKDVYGYVFGYDEPVLMVKLVDGWPLK